MQGWETQAFPAAKIKRWSPAAAEQGLSHSCSRDTPIHLGPWRLLPSLISLHWTCLVVKQRLDSRAGRGKETGMNCLC